MAFEYKVQILEQHLDTFGHVNNAAYFTLLESARWELMTQNGFSMQDVQQRQQGPVVLEAKIKFVKELRLREKVTITVETEGFQGKIGQLKQQIFGEKGDLKTEASFVFGFFDLKARKLIEPTEEWLSVLKV